MKIGFIGIGNMGYAMLQGALKAFDKSNLCFTDVNTSLVKQIADETGVTGFNSNVEVVKASDVVVVAIKPQYMAEVLVDIRGVLSQKQILLSPAAGLNIKYYRSELGFDARIVRCMPNTPALVGEGMSAYTYSSVDFTEEEKLFIEKFFASFGKAIELPEYLMDQVVPVSGSAPAYFFIMIEAMADAAVLTGLSRSDAYQMAAQTMLGAAKMILESGEHPAVLKDRVCSPGGTTIEAVKVLEEKGFRGTVMDAMIACYDKTKQFS